MRRRLALTVVATTSLVLVAFLVPLALLVRDLAAARATTAAEQDARALVQIVASVPDRAALQVAVERVDAASARAASVFLPDGRVLGTPARRDGSVAAAARGRAFTTDTGTGRAVLVPVRLSSGQTAVVRVHVPRALQSRGVPPAITVLVALGVTLLAVATVVADRLARAVVRPVEEQAAVARELASGRLDARVSLTGPPEVVAVGTALNRLAAHIRELLTAERERVADLSHRLRTPLTVLRLDVEALRDPAEAARLAADVDAVEYTVSSVIREARSSTDEAVLPASTDLGAVVRSRVGFWRPLAEDQRRRVSVEVPAEPCLVPVRETDLVAALDALIENVFAHTPEGVGFRVVATVQPDATRRLIVADDGPGLPGEVVARGVSGGRSTGLGLDIARRTAADAGGSLRRLPSPRGTVLALDFPPR